MIIVFETVLLLAYMINSFLGMGVMLCYILIHFFVKRRNDSIVRLLEMIIVTLPMSYIGFSGTSMHQLFSWYNIFLILFICKIIKTFSYKATINKSTAKGLFIILLCMVVNLFWESDVIEALAEMAQVFVMILPIAIVHTARRGFPVAKEDGYILICRYVDVCVATAIVMLIQYTLYYYAHMPIGIIHYSGGNRVAFYGLFRGASILPIYMGIGIVYLFIECFEKRITINRLLKIIIIFLAAILNTSRTALFALMLVMAFIYIKYYFRKPNLKSIFIATIGFVGSYFAIDYITTLRNKLTGFLDANGRLTTWQNGLGIWTENIKNFIIGEGFTGQRWIGITKPHNFVIQTVSQCGIIVLVIVLYMITKYIIDNKKNPYVYIPIFVLLSGMAVTDFYANAFTTVIFMLVDLYYAPLKQLRKDRYSIIS